MADHSFPSDWHQWVADNGPRLLLFARQQTHCEQDARDVFQDTLLEVWKRGKGGPPEPARLFATVRRRAIDLARRNQRRLQRESLWLSGLELENWFQAPPLESLSIEAELRKIHPQYAEVVLLKIWGELTFEQIGFTLGINPSTAASRYRYGLRDLRERLGDGRAFMENKAP